MEDKVQFSEGKKPVEIIPTEKVKNKKHVKISENKEIPENSEEVEITPVPFLQLYRFTTTKDRLHMLIAMVSALFASTGFPSMNILFGKMSDLLVNSGRGELICNGTVQIFPNESVTQRPLQENEEFLDEMSTFALYLACVAALQLVSRYLFISIFNRVAERQMYRLRKVYLRALLRQNVGWYDTVQDRNFISKISEMMTKVQEATGDKVGLCVYYTFNCILNLSVGFWYGWLLTLVVLSAAPVIAGASVVMSSLQTKFAVREQKQTAASGKVSEEALTNIRTVMAFSGQEKEIERYGKGLIHAMSAGKSRGVVSALGNGFLWFLNYASYSLAFWYGTKLIFEGQRTACEKTPEYGTAELMIVFFSVLSFSFNVGRAVSYLEVLSVGRAAAASIYTVIDRTPEIDSYSDTGRNPSQPPSGKIQFKNVSFSYPSRKEVQILRGLNLTITPGSTVALVGNSGCGKSTTLQLLQRFYDTDSGTVLLDDTDIKDLNISWLRSQLGVVSQEPILFNTTIAENIRYGREGVGQKEIEDACHLSNAHAFISKLPDKYETVVGDRGAQLSGGQKQRIAIARALVRNPSILLLDEATSALDTQSESIVQQALDKASKGRTTLIVAHRLSTIRTADLIVSIQDGQVAEIGTHHELLAKKGLYYHLVTAQVGDGDDDEDINSKAKEAGSSFDASNVRLSITVPEDELLAVIVAPLCDEGLTDKLVVNTHTTLRLLKLNIKEWPFILLGLINSIAHGAVLPVYAFYFGDFMDILSYTDSDKAQEEANKYAVIFLIIGGFAAVTIFAASACFSFAGEALTNRLRQMAFKKMLYQDVAWFDNPKNSVGALCARLSGDTASVQGATGSRLGTVVQSFTTLALAAGISLYVLPKAGAVALAFVPVIIIASFYNSVLIKNQQIEEKAAFEEASKLAFQAVSNIRTVASLCKEKAFVEMYGKLLLSPHKKALKHSHLMGFVHGLSESSLYCSYATVFYYGAYLITHENADYKSIFIIGEALIWSMLVLGQTLAFAPNYNKAQVSGARILQLLDTQPSIDLSPGTGLQIQSSQGSVIFEKTEFSYPTRPELKILKGLTLGIEPNLNLGICGPSGSGKSTCIQLILRYYDPTSGRVLFDETDVSSLNLNALRSQMALVAQEPALFDRTIAENIAYGDNSRELAMTEIIAAAKSANIHEFIASLPAGYETRVGEMGAQLSGGQKQRVAIARALVRNPKLLLLDEATSALDTESEKVVQAALENASSGRTCITIAHRLSSIQNADKILVVNNGALTEGGTHAELLSKRGIYFKLWNMQSHGHST